MAHLRPPTIGITCTEFRSQSGRLPPRSGQNQAYIDAVVRSGAAPLLIPLVPVPALLRTLYDLCDGLLLPGGGDVDPACYGESHHEKSGSISPRRDEVEFTLAHWAVDEAKPLLAICRGIQVLNVALGGSLYQDIAAQVPGAARHDWHPGHPRNRLSHTVIVDRQSYLAQIVGADEMAVNSLHHQALKQLAQGLIVTACAPDGIVEAVELHNHPFAVAVQWHPEELAAKDRRAQGLFDALFRASSP